MKESVKATIERNGFTISEECNWLGFSDFYITDGTDTLCLSFREECKSIRDIHSYSGYSSSASEYALNIAREILLMNKHKAESLDAILSAYNQTHTLLCKLGLTDED